MKKEDSISLVFLTRLTPESKYLVSKLCELEHINLSAIFNENRRLGQLKLINKKLNNKLKKDGIFSSVLLLLLLPFYFLKDRSMQKKLKQLLGDNEVNSQVKKFDFRDLNSQSCGKKLKELQPDFILVYGTGILQERIFSKSKIATLNMHMGITPEYRGSKSEFWALYNSEDHMVGSTIHIVDKGIDTGEVISQIYIDVQAEDDYVTLRAKNIQNLAQEIYRVMINIKQGQVNKISTTGRRSQFFSTPSLSQYRELDKRLGLK